MREYLCLYMGAALRWMRNHGRERFTIDEVYGIYSDLAPKRSRASRNTVADYLRRYHSLFAIRTTSETRRTDTGTELKVYTFAQVGTRIHKEVPAIRRDR